MTAPEDRKSGSGVLTAASMVATLIYLATVAFLAQRHWSDLQKLNAEGLGSLLQGVFSPLAFYWLVVGYFLQRRELELQRHEFRANNVTQVEQQRAMDRQADLIAAQLKVATNRANSELDAVFGFHWATSDQTNNLSVAVKNFGATGYSVICETEPPYVVVNPYVASHLLAGKIMSILVHPLPPSGDRVILKFQFTRQDGIRRMRSYALGVTDDTLTPLSSADVAETDPMCSREEAAKLNAPPTS